MDFTAACAHCTSAGLRQTPACVILTGFFLSSDSLLPGVSFARQHKCLEELNCDISVPSRRGW